MFDLDDSGKLKPCPFCGSEAEIVECDEPTNAGGHVVQCPKCLACSRVQFGESICRLLTEAWNRRADDAQIATFTAKLERLRDVWNGRSVNRDNELASVIDEILREVGP